MSNPSPTSFALAPCNSPLPSGASCRQFPGLVLFSGFLVFGYSRMIWNLATPYIEVQNFDIEVTTFDIEVAKKSFSIKVASISEFTTSTTEVHLLLNIVPDIQV